MIGKYAHFAPALEEQTKESVTNAKVMVIYSSEIGDSFLNGTEQSSDSRKAV